jgi:hypothetical protein
MSIKCDLCNSTRQLTGNKTLEEGLGGEIGVVSLEVLLAGGGELHGNELEATVLEARDDGADESTLGKCELMSFNGSNLY